MYEAPLIKALDGHLGRNGQVVIHPHVKKSQEIGLVQTWTQS